VRRLHTVIIGGGQAGLAMSHCLSDRGIEHVVLERGRIAERWRSERWDSLTLLTPNWLSRLPGFRYDGPDPDGYMTMPEVVDFFDRYARSIRAPVETGATVLRVESAGSDYRVETDHDTWLAANVVIATGYSDVPMVPAVSRVLPGDVLQVVPTRYRNPGQLPDGGVLVVGASASGIQLADEIHASGRPVTLAVGRHTRLPRRYRGKDILWWFDRMGLLDESIECVGNKEASRQQPALQLVGSRDHRSLDLGLLRDRGVRMAGRLLSADGWNVSFADDLVATTAAADVKLAGLLLRIDEVAARAGVLEGVGEPEPFVPCWPGFMAETAPTVLDLRAEGIRTVIWATGFRRSYPWLRVPVLDDRGEIRHDGGITPAPGLYVLGLQFLRRRNSAFIDGVGADAAALAEHLAFRQVPASTVFV
jgi:putative flavoprotein involved in K+ transport